jgi:hypothetical protein
VVLLFGGSHSCAGFGAYGQAKDENELYSVQAQPAAREIRASFQWKTSETKYHNACSQPAKWPAKCLDE